MNDWYTVGSLQCSSDEEIIDELNYYISLSNDNIPDSIESIIKEYKNNKRLIPIDKYELVMWLSTKG